MLLKTIKKYYIAYKRLKAIRLTKSLLPTKELIDNQLHFRLYQLEQHYLQQTPIPYLYKIKENLKKKYPRITEVLTKYPYLILIILYTLKGVSILLFGYLFYAK